MRTATLLLVATYSETMYPSVCVEAVEKLGTVCVRVCMRACIRPCVWRRCACGSLQ